MSLWFLGAMWWVSEPVRAERRKKEGKLARDSIESRAARHPESFIHEHQVAPPEKNLDVGGPLTVVCIGRFDGQGWCRLQGQVAAVSTSFYHPPAVCSRTHLISLSFLLLSCEIAIIVPWHSMSWVRKIPWRRKWQPTPGFLPEESHGQGSLTGYSPWGCKELNTTEVT